MWGGAVRGEGRFKEMTTGGCSSKAASKLWDSRRREQVCVYTWSCSEWVGKKLDRLKSRYSFISGADWKQLHF